MSNYPSQANTHAWQQPGFMDQLNRSLMPNRPQAAPKRKKEEKERLYKQVTRRLAR